jgi:hypothetical protein
MGTGRGKKVVIRPRTGSKGEEAGSIFYGTPAAIKRRKIGEADKTVG